MPTSSIDALAKTPSQGNDVGAGSETVAAKLPPPSDIDLSADTLAASDPYLGGLQPEDRERYLACSGDLDLTDEIRLMRTVLAHLAGDISGNKSTLASHFGVLVRAVSIQASRLAGPGKLEQALLAAAELALDGQRREAAEEKE